MAKTKAQQLPIQRQALLDLNPHLTQKKPKPVAEENDEKPKPGKGK